MKIARWSGGCVVLVIALLLSLPMLVASGSSVTGTVSGVTGAASLPIPTDIGVPHKIPLQPLFPWTPANGEPVLAGYPTGQCTWFVSWEGHTAGNHRVTWGGDAWMWVMSAMTSGATVLPASTPPQVGWIAVYAPFYGSSMFGHVAVVVNVTATTYTIAEMNVLATGVADVRTLRIGGGSPLLEGWIP